MKNEPAFPIPATEYHGMDSGMTLRDYFAANVINGILSDPNAGLLEDDLSRYANIAYKAADAMLKARG
ncbi:hypothetical protein NHG68_15440 [Enterobacter sp. Z1]|uniref:hypothetical protein n=1 Tax=Enterobacter sp. Z1 TaxID=2561927 RepID=UPI0011E04EBB|nr:hypothetical protein [Enterobacter sp. Z1]TYD05500.1 hypothetical protein E4M14_009620 [Enterobacter sp. Z1]USX30402.1 hypothetical protein NHG68_15440 [Enterobacter sp. Z1]